MPKLYKNTNSYSNIYINIYTHPNKHSYVCLCGRIPPSFPWMVLAHRAVYQPLKGAFPPSTALAPSCNVIPMTLEVSFTIIIVL